MKLLLDMNVTHRWAPALAAQGHEVVHWRDVGDRRARDSEIMTYALRHGFDLKKARVRLLPLQSR